MSGKLTFNTLACFPVVVSHVYSSNVFNSLGEEEHTITTHMCICTNVLMSHYRNISYGWYHRWIGNARGSHSFNQFSLLYSGSITIRDDDRKNDAHAGCFVSRYIVLIRDIVRFCNQTSDKITRRHQLSTFHHLSNHIRAGNISCVVSVLDNVEDY